MNQFLRLAHLHSDTFICFEKIAYVQRIEDVIFIHFDGDSKPIQLRNEAANVFLRIIQDNSLTVCIEEPGAEDKNAEISTHQDFSENHD